MSETGYQPPRRRAALLAFLGEHGYVPRGTATERTVMRPFELRRDTDISGVSGTGKVAEGVVFSDGEAVVHWLGTWPTTTPHPKGVESIKAIHGHGGATQIVFSGAEDRLGRIAEAHAKHVDQHGGTDGMCTECGHAWPCPTYVWATTNRQAIATWDPDDDESDEGAP